MSADDLLIAESLHIARSAHASDLHFVVGRPPALRVEGKLAFTAAASVDGAQLLQTIRNVLPDEAWSVYQRAGDAGAAHHGTFGPLRLHAYSTSAGPALAIRLLPQEIPTLESLRLPSIVGEFADASSGLVVFCGPTGSGKTSSLAGVVERINATSARVVVIVEDPIEYVHHSRLSIVHQREVGRDVRSYEDGLLSALRCDPDVIVMGEVRSARAIRAAIKAAETGHLVVTTLHAGDAMRAVARLVDAFPPERHAEVRSELADVFLGIVAQRLVARVEGGRCCAAEVLSATRATRSLIREGKLHQLRGAMEVGRAAGMQTLESDLERLVAAGVACEREALRWVSGSQDLPSSRGLAS